MYREQVQQYSSYPRTLIFRLRSTDEPFCVYFLS